MMTWTDMENFFTRFLEIAGQIEGEKFYSYSIAVSRVLSRQYARCFLQIILIIRLFQRGKSFCQFLLAPCCSCLGVLLSDLDTPQIVSSFLPHVAFSLFLYLLYLYLDIYILCYLLSVKSHLRVFMSKHSTFWRID